MDPDLKQQLEEMHALVKDNHRMLRAIRRAAWLSTFGQIVWWVVILGISGYLYQHYLSPYVNLLPSSAQLEKLVNSTPANP